MRFVGSNSRAMCNLEEYTSQVVELPAVFQVYKNLVIFRSAKANFLLRNGFCVFDCILDICWKLVNTN